MGLSTVDMFKHIDNAEGLIKVEGDALELLQALLTEMLSDIDAVCRELGIDYVLGGGNCLGAIRHGGFIPWDDDADIDMTREGYKLFVPAFLERFGDKYWVHDVARRDEYELCFPRIRMKGTVLRSREDFEEDECGVYVDLFLLENTPNTPLFRKLHGIGSLGLGLLWSCRRFAEHEQAYKKLLEGNAANCSAFRRKVLIGRLVSFASVKWWARAWDNWNALCRNRESEFVACPVGRKHYFGELWRRDTIFPAKRVPYGNTTLCVPKRVEEWLTTLYGDYMRIPPVEDRETHVVYELDLGNREQRDMASGRRKGA